MLRFILLVLAIIALALGFWARNHVRYSAVRLAMAIDRGELTTVKKHADLKAFSEVPVDAMLLAGTDKAEKLGGNAAGALVNLIGGLFANAAKSGPAPEYVLEQAILLRQADQLDKVFTFEPKSLLTGELRQSEYGAILTLEGSCQKRGEENVRIPASIGVRFSRVDGPLWSYPRDWRAIGVDPNSLKAFVAACVVVP